MVIARRFRNFCRGVLRRRRRERTLGERDLDQPRLGGRLLDSVLDARRTETPDEVVIQDELLLRLHAGRRFLSQADRELLDMYADCRNYHKIARELGVPYGTVRHRFLAIRDRLYKWCRGFV